MESLDKARVMEPLEIVEWSDAWEETAETSISPRSLTKLSKGMLTRTVGWVISDTPEGVLMIGERWPTMPSKAKYVTFIPSGMILKRTKLTEAPSP